jgi:branched-chain amino acid transport system substrate-binding protein
LSRKTSLRGLAAIAVLAVVAAACSSSNNNTTPSGSSGGGGAQKTVKLAFMGALTGAASQAVIPGYQGASLAVDEANSGKFGTLPVKIEIVQEDTQGSATQGAPVARKVTGDPSIVGVLGPNFSGESAAAGPILDQAGIPFVTWSATNPTLSTNGWTHWFRANGNDNSQGPAAADYISKVLKPNCAFVLSDDTPYGKGLGQIVVNTLGQANVNVTADLGAVPQGGTGQTKDFSPFITKIKQSNCAAVFYGGYDAEAGPLRAQMTQQGLTKVTLVGGDGAFTGTFLKDAAAAGNGSVMTCPCGDITKSHATGASTFISDYKSKWGQDPAIYSADAFDVTRIFINAFIAGNTTPDAITTYLTSVHYIGLARDYSFQANHELTAADVKIFYWKDVNQKWTFLGLSTDVAK